MFNVPDELSKYFVSKHFEQYPKVEIPQTFRDERGDIINIADGQLGDVAIIQSKERAVRANHVHQSDWHLSYCLSGSLDYSYLALGGKLVTMRIEAGELFFTPSGVPHRMDFLKETLLVVVSRNSRRSDRYDEDTQKYLLSIESER